MTIKVIVFDFDGTIADTQGVLLDITNRLASEFGYSPIDQTELSRLKNLTSSQIIRESKIPKFKLPFLLKRVREELGKEIEKLQPVEGLESCLKNLQERGYKLGILTSNIKVNVVNFLTLNNLETLFNFIYSGSSIFGKNKVINQLLKQQKFRPQEMVYVGDETRDIEAAKKSNVKVVAVTWGFNSESILAQHHPDYLITKPEDLITSILGIEN